MDEQTGVVGSEFSNLIDKSLALDSLLFALLLVGSFAVNAANWHGTIMSKMQVDSRYTNDASYFGEMIGRFEYEDKKLDIQSGVDLLLRYGNYDFNNRQDFYRLFIQKGFKAYHTTLKAGRFEQADSLGFLYPEWRIGTLSIG